ncbi:MAG: hypothetical protein ONB05_07690 [candidate division KSB1 bacterium]|nr:hypothetical protein [candidate division KSB1 bacterium]
MRLKFTLVALSILAGFNLAQGQDVEGLWGLSAGLYANSLNEVAISYGVSNRTMLLLFANISYDDWEDELETIIDTTRTRTTRSSGHKLANVGPEIRGFFYLGGKIAPYGGVRIAGGWHSSKNNIQDAGWDRNRQLQLTFSLTYGAEYFFNEHLSIYAHMNLFSYSFIRTTQETYQTSSDRTSKVTSKVHRLDFSQRPALFLKFYF